jgi:hypothetical protein
MSLSKIVSKKGLDLVRKTRCISYNMAGRKNPQSVDSKVLTRIYGMRKGGVFTPIRFLDLGTRGAIDVALFRLLKKGVIRRLARGLFDYPQIHPELGLLSPSADKIAEALAKKDQIRLQPAGAYAANLLGLSEQVPGKVVFLTVGPSRTVKFGRREIRLRHTTPRSMAAAGRLSGLLIQAFKNLGKEHITPARVAHLKRTLSNAKRKQLLRDLTLAPAWMHQIFREIAQA